MVASLRCGELREESLAEAAPSVYKLKEDTDKRVIGDFQDRCRVIIMQALGHYDEFAHQYDKTIYDKNRKEMIQTLMTQSLYLCFEQQLKQIRNATYQQFEKQALKKPNRDEVNEFFYEQTEGAFTNTMSSFRKQATELIVDGSGWGEHVVAYETELSL